MHRVWITPTWSARAGRDRGMTAYSGSRIPFRLTTPRRPPPSSPTYSVWSARARRAVFL